MIRRILQYGLGVFAAAIFGLVPFQVDAEDSQEYLLKAAFIYKFAQVVEWPGGLPTPVNVCALGDVPLARMKPMFDKVNASNPAQHFNLVEEKSWKNAVANCHILFVGASEEGRMGEGMALLKDKPVLTIGNFGGFIDKGGMIGFVLQKNTIKFEVNLQSMTAAGLRVKAELLEIAVRVVK